MIRLNQSYTEDSWDQERRNQTGEVNLENQKMDDIQKVHVFLTKIAQECRKNEDCV